MGDSDNPHIQLIADQSEDFENLTSVSLTDDVVGILPLRNMALFPAVVMPCTIGRSSSLSLLKEAEKSNALIGVVSQKKPDIDAPALTDLYSIGTLARVLKVITLPDDTHTAIIQGITRIKLVSAVETEPQLRAKVSVLPFTAPGKKDDEFSALSSAIRSTWQKFISLVKQNSPMQFSQGFAPNIQLPPDDRIMVNFVAASLPVTVKEKNDMLRIGSLKKRGWKLMSLLSREYKLMSLKANIQDKTRIELDRQQKEYFLHQQIKNIQEELGENPESSELNKLEEKISSLPESTQEEAKRVLSQLRSLPSQSPDYSPLLSWLRTVTSLPWNKTTVDNLNIAHAKNELSKAHYGLDNVKERILEMISTLSLHGEAVAPVFLFYGPPGVGKTSMALSIAKALGREYVRVSLGGIHDEAEIRGHRRTYVGAMPGRIIASLIKAHSSNPVFVLDEIDKVTSSPATGDPASALLEVLDPEQNSAFHDNYIDIDFDLSKVMFIATANSLSTIPSPLLDRMEPIEMSGYMMEEKVEIARRYLLPRALRNAGLTGENKKTITRQGLELLITQYTRESGVRQLERKLDEVMRKVALSIVAPSLSPIGSKNAKSFRTITPSIITTLLGKPLFPPQLREKQDYPGVATGMAWTSAGGVILFIETSLSHGTGGQLTLTGNLGDVMKESAMLAVEYIKAHADSLSIDWRIFSHWNIHIHVPEGATPKDGPSAGITIAVSIASALTSKPVRMNFAMTGELTLTGRVLPVGGIKEKILAARSYGITDIILPDGNRRDVQEIPQKYVSSLTFHYVDNLAQVFSLALCDGTASQKNSGLDNI